MQNMSCGRGFGACCWTAAATAATAAAAAAAAAAPPSPPCCLPPSRLLLFSPRSSAMNAASSLARQTSSLLLPQQLRDQSLLLLHNNNSNNNSKKLHRDGARFWILQEEEDSGRNGGGHWNWRWSAAALTRPFASLGKRPQQQQQQSQPQQQQPQQQQQQDNKEKEKTQGMRIPEEEEEADSNGNSNSNSKLGKPEECTADELHYVAVPGTPWRLSLWRYLPSASGPKRNHPVLMLSGIGTNAIGFDLDPNVSLARHLSGAGFDTWILEVRGAGLSKREGEPTSSELAGTGRAFTGAVQDAFVQATVKTATSRTATTEEKKNRSPQGNAEAVEKESTAAAVKKVNKPVAVQETTAAAAAVIEEVQKATAAQETTPVKKVDESVPGSPETMAIEKGNDSEPDQETMATRLTNSVLQFSQKLSGLVSEGQSQLLSARFIEQISSLLEDGVLSGRLGELRERLTSLVEGRYSNSTLSTQITDLTKRVTLLLEEGQRSVSPRVSNLQERLNATIGEFQEILDLIVEYDWDFDNYLTEDVPAAMDYVLSHSASTDGKVLGVGHSMGGILLYAMLATRAERAALAGAVTVASSLDYGVSETSLKHLLPLADPAVLFNVPVIPLGAMMSALHPLVSRPPYALSYLGYQVSARQMMDPTLFKKLVLNNFCTVPVKLLLHLSTVFQPGGLRDRSGTFIYKDGLENCKVPVLAIAGDLDLICPPPAVLDTIKAFPGGNATYKLFGGKHERHYGHYDLLCARTAKQEVYPVVEHFLEKCDGSKSRFVK